MSAALQGLEVLDMTRSIAGSMASMLLADQGAVVTKLEPPGGDPVRDEPGARVWMRNKRSVTVDLPADAGAVVEMARGADLYLDSWTPAQAAELGITDDLLASANPRLVRCSITAYGSIARHAGRPDDPFLVAARSGLMWEQKGWVGGPIARLSGTPPLAPDLVAPPGCWDGCERTGPIHPATPQPAIAAAYLGALAALSAIHARGRTGRGQRVETSMLQGVLAATWGAWQRAEHPDAPSYDSWVFDSRSHRGHFECADGRWICHWVPRPAFVLGVSNGDALDPQAEIPPIHLDSARIMPDPADLAVLHHYHPLMVEAFRRFSAEEWTKVAAATDNALQPVMTMEEALDDPLLIADGSVITVGGVRQPGLAIRLHGCDPSVAEPSAAADTQQTGEKDAPRASHAPPLDGILVVDLGLAVAGPWGTQMLSDLGAQVIKVNRKSDSYWHATHMAMACNRGKLGLALNLRKPAGQEVLHSLVARADVVHTNMRRTAATRLGVDYERLRGVNPDLIYCHTAGFDDARADLPGNDQTGGALAGVLHADGGCERGGRPAWSLTSLGDVGNGFLSAIGVVMALIHRNRTGQGQLVTTSIVRAQLLAASAWLGPDGSGSGRPLLDANQLGFSARRRLYETRSGWLCLGVRTDDQWGSFCRAVDRADLLADRDDETLAAELESTFSGRPAAEWCSILDAAGVPVELCDPDVALGLFDDPDLLERSWVTRYDQPLVGALSQLGLLFDFSDTPARIAGPPLVVGDSSRFVLSQLGYGDGEIDQLIADRIVYDSGAS